MVFINDTCMYPVGEKRANTAVMFRYRLPKTRSMDNLVCAFENGVALTRTSSDPNLNKHCQEGRSPLEPIMGQGGSFTDNLEFTYDTKLCNEHQEVDTCEEMPPSPKSDQDSCVSNGSESCLTTQPLPSLPHPLTLDPVSAPSQAAPILQQTLLLMSSPPLPPLPPEVQTRTVSNTTCTFTATDEPPNTPVSNGIEKEECTTETFSFPSPTAAELLEIKKLTALVHLEDSTETIKDEYGTVVPEPHSAQKLNTGKIPVSALATNDEKWTQSVKKLLRAQSGSTNGGYREAQRNLSSPVQLGWMSAVKNVAICTSFSSALGPSFRQIQSAAHCVDDDGLPVPLDAVQQRLRQIEASYKQEVEVLRRQVKQLQMKLESRQHSSPPSEPDIYYEDDIVSAAQVSEEEK